MADQPDNEQRTEEPTQKRLDDARKKGDAPKSQETIAAVMLAAGVVAIWVFSGPVATALMEVGVVFIGRPHEFAMDAGALQRLFVQIAIAGGASLGAVSVLIIGAALLANTAQARPVFTTERMKPSFKKISPLAGVKRIFGPSGLFNFAKGVGKLVIVGAILVIALWPDREILVTVLYQNADATLMTARDIILKLVGLAVLSMVIIAAFDFAFQRYSWKKRLRMTKEEVKRELKETEGDPQIRARLRQLREQRARRRALAAVKEATVVIMNPTHFAVALDYAMGSERAPVCVAKGVDTLALRMRETAQEHDVPVIENPPLARALYASVEEEQEIPLEHFEAVARIIGYIMAKAGKPPGATSH